MQMNRLDISVNILSLNSFTEENLFSMSSIPNYAIAKYITDYTGGVFLEESEILKILNKTTFQKTKNIISLNSSSKNNIEKKQVCQIMNNFNRKILCHQCSDSIKVLLCKKPFLCRDNKYNIEINKDIFHFKRSIQELGFNFRAVSNLNLTKNFKITHKEVFEKYSIKVPIKRIIETRIRESFQMISSTDKNYVYFELEMLPDILLIYEVLNKDDNDEKQIKIRFKTSFERFNFLKITQNKSQEQHPLLFSITEFIKEIVANDMILNILSKTFSDTINLDDGKTKDDFIANHKSVWECLCNLTIHSWYRFFNVENIEVLIIKKKYDSDSIIEKLCCEDEEDYFSIKELKENKEIKINESPLLIKNETFVVKKDTKNNILNSINVNQKDKKEITNTMPINYKERIGLAKQTPIININTPYEDESKIAINLIEQLLFDYSDMTILKGNIIHNYKVAFSSLSVKQRKSYIKLIHKSINKDNKKSMNGFCLIKLEKVYDNLIIVYFAFYQCFIKIRRDIISDLYDKLNKLFKPEDKIELKCSDKHLVLLIPKDVDSPSSVFTYFPNSKLINNFLQTKSYKYPILYYLHTRDFLTQLIKLRLSEGFILVDNNRNNLLLVHTINIARYKINGESNKDEKLTAILYKITILKDEIFVELLVEPGSGHEYKSQENELRVFEEKTYFNSLVKYIKDNDKHIYDYIRNIYCLIKDIISNESFVNYDISSNHLNEKIISKADYCLFNKVEPFSTRNNEETISKAYQKLTESYIGIKSKIIDDKFKFRKDILVDNLYSEYKEIGYRIQTKDQIMQRDFSIIEQNNISSFYQLFKDMFNNITDYQFEDDNIIFYCKLLSSCSLLLIRYPSIDKVCNCCHNQLNSNNNAIEIHIKYYLIDLNKTNLYHNIMNQCLLNISVCRLDDAFSAETITNKYSLELISTADSVNKYMLYINSLYKILFQKYCLLMLNDDFTIINKAELISYNFEINMEHIRNISSVTSILFYPYEYFIDLVYNILYNNVKYIKTSTYHSNYHSENDLFLIEITIDNNNILINNETDKLTFKQLLMENKSNIKFNILFFPSIEDIYTNKPCNEEKMNELNYLSSTLFYKMSNMKIPLFIHLIEKDYYVKIPHSHSECLNEILQSYQALLLTHEINCLRIINNSNTSSTINRKLCNSTIYSILKGIDKPHLNTYLHCNSLIFNTVDKDEVIKLFNSSALEYFSSFEHEYNKIFTFNWDSNDSDLLSFKDYYQRYIDDVKVNKGVKYDYSSFINKYESLYINDSANSYIPCFVFMRLNKDATTSNSIQINIEFLNFEKDKYSILSDKIKVLLGSIFKKINKQILLLNLFLTNNLDRKLLPKDSEESKENEFSLELTYDMRYTLDSVYAEDVFKQVIIEAQKQFEIKNNSEYFSTFNILSSDVSIFKICLDIEGTKASFIDSSSRISKSIQRNSEESIISNNTLLNTSIKSASYVILIKYYGLKVPSQFVTDSMRQFVKDRILLIKTRKQWDELKKFNIKDLSLLNKDLSSCFDTIRQDEDKIFLDNNKIISDQLNSLFDSGRSIWVKVNDYKIEDMTLNDINLLIISSHKINISSNNDLLIGFDNLNDHFAVNFYDYLLLLDFTMKKIPIGKKENTKITKNLFSNDLSQVKNNTLTIDNKAFSDYVIAIKTEIDSILLLIYVNFYKEDNCNFEFVVLKQKDDNKEVNLSYDDLVQKQDICWFLMKIVEDFVFVANVLYFK